MEKTNFRCLHCHKLVSLKASGTKHRNHCPYCLWSKHINTCNGAMTPIGLTFKKEGIDRYTKKPKQGELMLIHQCLQCGKLSINRIAGDDNSYSLLKIFEHSINMPTNLRKKLLKQGIEALTKKDKQEIKKQVGIKNL